MLAQTRRRSLQHYSMKERYKSSTYQTIRGQYPKLTYLFINDLLKIEGYSDVEIGFASGVPLNVLRKIMRGEQENITSTIFYKIFGLYARVFCDWRNYPDPLEWWQK